MGLPPIPMKSDEELFSPRSNKVFEELDSQLEKIVHFKYMLVSDTDISQEELEKTKILAISLIEKLHPLVEELKEAVALIDPNNLESFTHFERVLQKIM